MITAAQARALGVGDISSTMKHFLEEWHVEDEIRDAAMNGQDYVYIRTPLFYSKEMLQRWMRDNWPSIKEVKMFFASFGYCVNMYLQHKSSDDTLDEGIKFYCYYEYLISWAIS